MTVLRSDALELTVDPDDGCRLSSLRFRGDEVLVTDGTRPWGEHSFVMAPWAGRVRDGVAHWCGRELRLPPDLEEPHSLHGLVHDRAWQPAGVAHESAATWVVEISDDEWFAPLRLEQTIAVDGAHVRLGLEVTAPNGPAPATVGWHPWFRRHLDGSAVQIELDAAAMLQRDAAGIATTAQVAIPDGPVDDAFVGLAGPVRVVYPGRLEVEVDSDAPVMVVFTRNPQGICVEPQSGPPDQVNVSPHVVTADTPLRLHSTWRFTSLR